VLVNMLVGPGFVKTFFNVPEKMADASILHYFSGISPVSAAHHGGRQHGLAERLKNSMTVLRI